MGLADFATIKKKEDFPGPGQYGNFSSFGKVNNTTVTIKERVRAQNSPRIAGTTDVVGPGKYDLGTTVGDGPHYTFGTPRKGGGASELHQTDLGPKYSPRQRSMAEDPASPRYSFGHKTKGSGAADHRGPGPIYHLPTTLSPRGPTMQRPLSPKRKKGSTLAGPGPGEYQVPRFGDKLPVPRNVTTHDTFRESARNPGPGPGDYDVDHYSIEAGVRKGNLSPRTGPSWGSRNYPPLAAPCGLPGPAAYNVDFTEKGKAVTIAQRPEKNSELEAIYPKPGPGEYDIPSIFDTKASASKGFTITSRLPPPASKEDVPGPGSYAATQHSVGVPYQQAQEWRSGERYKGVGFNKSSHQQMTTDVSSQANNAEVGPGSYNPGFVHKPKQPAFTIGARNYVSYESDQTKTPGPGTYNVKDPLKITGNTGKGFTFYRGPHQQREMGVENDGPGPIYDAERSFAATKPQNAVTFGLHQTSPRR